MYKDQQDRIEKIHRYKTRQALRRSKRESGKQTAMICKLISKAMYHEEQSKKWRYRYEEITRVIHYLNEYSSLLPPREVHWGNCPLYNWPVREPIEVRPMSSAPDYPTYQEMHVQLLHWLKCEVQKDHPIFRSSHFRLITDSGDIYYQFTDEAFGALTTKQAIMYVAEELARAWRKE